MKIPNLSTLAILILLTLTVLPVLAQNQEKKSLDTRLVGIWVGSEADGQMEGLQKEWSMERKSNGKFSLNFMSTYMGQK